MKWNKVALLAKIETTYGTDAAPTGTANAILARNFNLTPLAAETVERDNPRPELGAYQKIHVGARVMLDFDVEMAGAGSAGGIPAYGVLMRGCALKQTNNAGVSTVYDLISQGEEALTLYFNLDGKLHKLIGARGDWGIKISAKGLPYWHFAFTGLWADASDTPLPTTDYSAFTAPAPISNSNTPTATLFGNNIKMSSFEIAGNNNVVHRDLVGVEEVVITDRSVSGKIEFEVPPAGFDVINTAKANTLGALQIIHGSVAGSIVQIDAPKAQIVNPTYTEQDKFVFISADLVLVPNAGDDEIKLTIK